MVSPQTGSSLLELIEKSELLPPEQFAALAPRLESLRPIQIAQTLVKQGRLTRFQANRLLEGHYRGFFIDEYRLLEILGTGGMGRVYLASDPQGRKVALKVLSEIHREDRGMVARLQLEARAGMKLDHPHIVHTIAIRESQLGFHSQYLVAEFVKGVSLQELVVMFGRRAWAQACDFARQAAEGLQHAHASGLIHRDIKPANLLVDHEGHVKILDFGLALVHDEGDSEFSLSMIFGHECLGTADFMPPEQSQDSSEVDPRADIYSLGGTLYWTITGVLPHSKPQPDADLVEVHHQHLERIPAELVAVIDKMLEQDPDRRYQTADEAAAALAPFAKRKHVAFDFQKVLKMRAIEARRKRHRTASKNRTSTVAIRAQETEPREPPSIAGIPAPVSGVDRRPDDYPELAPPTGAPAFDDGGQTAYLVSLDDGGLIPLLESRIVIGREPDCEIGLASTAVSGWHCELRREGDFWRVIDLDSKNGIRVNGKRTAGQVLWHGDRLTIAEQYRFRLRHAPSRRPRSGGWKLVLAALVLGGLAAAWWWLQNRDAGVEAEPVAPAAEAAD